MVAWLSKPGALYCIEISETLDNDWSPVEDKVPAHASDTTTTCDLGNPAGLRRFYRVVLK
ncbi:MAG: hypothetical protein OSA48_11200 [Akkermansiaceae bacterium]|nr:hypothetical protein [Akkermansiaceae bacterium]